MSKICKMNPFLLLFGFQMMNHFGSVTAEISSKGEKLLKIAMKSILDNKTFVLIDQNDQPVYSYGSMINQSSISYSYKHQPLLLFKAKAGRSDRKLREFYQNGAVSETFLPFSTTASSLDTYKSPLLEMWAQLPIQKVSYSMYKAGVKRAELIFDATGSDKSNWMSKEKLISCFPWSLAAVQQKNIPIFQIEGVTGIEYDRSFIAMESRTPPQCSGDYCLIGVYQKSPDCPYVTEPAPVFKICYDETSGSVGQVISQSENMDEMTIEAFMHPDSTILNAQ